MSYRPHGRAEIDPSKPRALGICDRCGGRYNHHTLSWQFDWRGPKIQNLRFLVCPSCMDRLQQSGQRTILLPADPIPVQNARPEWHVPINNPLSAVGADASPTRWMFGSQIGNLTELGGVASAFNGSANKTYRQSACLSVSHSSYDNYLGISWSGNPSAAPPGLPPPLITHSVGSFTITAPNDRSIGSTAYVIQGSPVNTYLWGSWTTLASGSLAGTIGEKVSAAIGGSPYAYHRVAFLGDGVHPIYVAQVTFSVNEEGIVYPGGGVA